MSKLSFRARALDASKPMPIYLAEELPDLPDYSAINRAVPQMPSGMEKEEESEHHLQRAISGTGLIIPTPEVCEVSDLEFYERCYPPDYKMPKQHIHMQPLWEEQETPEYDIDTEDERWLKQQGHPELTELLFEQMMDKLEKCSGQTVVTLNEAKLLLERKDDLVIAVYDYWLNKRLNTQHPLILSVKTESRPGQSSNNPYLAFRRRTEKMQTRKNRKNDESSYEKMLKLRRELSRALTLLQLVARREQAKRDLVQLTARLAAARHRARDYSEPEPSKPQYTAVALPPASFRREQYSIQHYPPRPPTTPVEPRQREKRPYKRRKYRHQPVGTALRESGVCTSSEEESGGRAEAASPPDDGPFAFRRKPGCYYEMPTSTLRGDPVDPDNPDGLYQHEIDVRHRFTLSSICTPHPQCVGFARRRVGRGGRVLLDRVRTKLDHLWATHPFTSRKATDQEQKELETGKHRSPKEVTQDYHTSGRYPWRHNFRKHLKQHPHLWTSDVKPDIDDVKMDVCDVKLDLNDVKMDVDGVKVECNDYKSDLPQDGDISVRISDDKVNSDSEVSPDQSRSELDRYVTENLRCVMRERDWSDDSDHSYDSGDSLYPVEKEFHKFITEVDTKWLHFRPKTPPPVSPEPLEDPHQFPISTDTPITVELRPAEPPPSDCLDPFVTSEFTLQDLYGEVIPENDNSGTSLEISDDLINENLALTDDQVESLLSETDLKIDDKKIADDLLDIDKDCFLFRGHRLAGRGRERFGSSVVCLSADKETIYMDQVEHIEEKVKAEKPDPLPVAPKADPPKEVKVELPVTTQVPNSKIIVEQVNDVPQQQIKPEKKRSSDTVEEVWLPHGVQLKTVHTKHSPLKKHIITATAQHRHDVTPQRHDVTSQRHDVTPQHRHDVTLLAPSRAKDQPQQQVRVQAAASESTTTIHNGPFVTAAAQARDPATGVVVSVRSSPPTRAPLLQLAHKHLLHPTHPTHPTHQTHPTHPPLVVAHSHLHHVPTNKLKVLHAHPLTHTQRTQLLAQNRTITQLPAVVSLATLAEAKPPNTALLKATPGSVTQFFEIKSGQLGKGPHLVNVVRQQQPGKTTVARLDLNDAKKRQVVATFDGSALKGNIQTITRPHRVNVSLDGRQIVRAAIPAVRAPHVRHQIQLKNRTFQVAQPIARTSSEPSTSISVPTTTKTASIPSSVVANLLQKNVQLPKGGQKIAISGPGGQPLSANVQAIAFSTAQLKARQARLITQPRPTPVAELVEAPTSSSSGGSHSRQTGVGAAGAGGPLEAGEEGGATNGGVRPRGADTLPMEVT